MDLRIGSGYDVHQFAENRKFILGGIEIPHHKGLLGHSDADVLLHAISDALLGSLALGDIGKHFPDTDEKFKDADSFKLLVKCRELVESKGYSVVNVDSTVLLQKPKIAPYIDAIREKISEALKIDKERVSVKATTTEKLGFVGREEGVSAYATVLVNSK